MQYNKYLFDPVLQNEVAVWGGLLFDNWLLRVHQLWYREYERSCRHAPTHIVHN